jgi:hypothetical protein
MKWSGWQGQEAWRERFLCPLHGIPSHNPSIGSSVPGPRGTHKTTLIRNWLAKTPRLLCTC